MLDRSLIEMLKCRLREFIREPSAMFFVLLVPILSMVILGTIFSGKGPVRYAVGLVESQSENFAAVQKALKDSDQVVLSEGREDVLTGDLATGKLVLVVSVEEKLRYVFDPNHPQGSSARDVIDSEIQQAFGRLDSIETENQWVETAGKRYVDFLIPGLLALSLLTTSLFGTGMTLVSNRKENLLKRYRATPMKPHLYIVSHLFGRLLILAIEVTAIMLAGYLFFGFKTEGHPLVFIAFAILGAWVFTAMAIFVGSRLKNTAAYNGIVNLITIPMMLFSGIWYSRNGFPDWLKDFVDLLPLTAVADGLRLIALKGAGFGELGFELAVLSAYGIVCFFGARMTFKWY